jgi:DNA-binding Xre family transcriptional regulator
MVSYRKLWVRLAERELKKKDLCRVAGISATVVTKLGRGESVTTDVLVRICNALDCDFGDIMEMVDTDAEISIER